MLSRKNDIGLLQCDLCHGLSDTRHYDTAQPFFARRLAQQITGGEVFIDNQNVGHKTMRYLGVVL
jgi:hypothetical protein